MAARKPTPVDVVFFPKRPRAPERSVTATIPEIQVVDVDPATEVDVSVSGARKRTRTSKSHPRVTLSGEKAQPQESSQNGLSEMAALGHELFSRGKVHEARVVFEGLVVANPKDSFAQTMLGTVHLALQDLDRALECFEAALKVDPNDVAALVYRGEIRLNRKKTRAAADDFTRAMQVGADDDPFVERARRLLRMARKTTRS